MKYLHILILISTISFSQNQTFEFDSIYLNHELTKEVEAYLENSVGVNKFSGDFNGIKASNVEGKEVELKSNNKITVYNFWYVGCAPCISEIPMLNSLQEKYKNEVDFIAITFSSPQEVKNILNIRNFNFEHFFIDKQTLDLHYGKYGYPTTIIVSNNKILYSKTGGLSDKTNKYYYIKLNLLYKKISTILEENLSSK